MTILIPPNTRNSFFHLPPSLALVFFFQLRLPIPTAEFQFFQHWFQFRWSKFSHFLQVRLFTESLRLHLRFQNVCVYYFFFLQKHFNGRKYVWSKIMVGRQYELYLNYYRKQYKKLLNFLNPNSLQWLYFFIYLLRLWSTLWIYFDSESPLWLQALSFFYSTQPVPKRLRSRFIEDTFVFSSNVHLSGIEV